ncbi:MFS transporter [Streptomyces sp. S816]|uniref:MFS transporter n=1 Tax=Streptomyces TaxID=1883 RepID=UPI00113F0C71|nr:MFS transporter [Streptomyces sp. S816]TGZ14886.1 MFS transporter [Streptomyces sp. S816]
MPRSESETPPLWRNRDYNLWWGGSAVSQLGSGVSQLAYPLLILGVADSASAAGIVAACANIGYLGASIPAGVAADRVSRRVLLIVSSVVQLVLMAAVGLAVAGGHVWVPQIAVTALVQGVMSALHQAATTPALRRIVAPAQLKVAFAREQARDMGTQLAGSPLGGLLFGLARWIPFVFDAVSYLFVTLAALFIRSPLGPDRAEEKTAEPTSVRQDVGEGLRFLRRDSFLRFLLLWAALSNCTLAGLAFMFVVALRHHGASASVIGTSESIVMACGLLGALAAGRIVRRVSGFQIVVTMSWLMVAGTLGVAALVARPWPAALCFGSLVFFMTPLNVTFEARMAATVPDRIAGRVMMTTSMAAQSLKWLAPLVCGALADRFSPTAPILGLAAVFALLAVAIHLTPALRRFDDAPHTGDDTGLAAPDAAPEPATPETAGRDAEPAR